MSLSLASPKQCIWLNRIAYKIAYLTCFDFMNIIHTQIQTCTRTHIAHTNTHVLVKQ